MSDQVETNNRTHEPTLRELTSELDGQRAFVLSRIDALKEIIDERDRRYQERDEARRAAIDASLIAAKEQTAASFAASEKAIAKAEEAQRAYNQSHNDLAKKMDEQNKAMMLRSESEGRFHAVEEKINDIRNAMAAGGGMLHGSQIVKDESRANVALIVAALGTMLALLMLLLRLWKP
jgi:chromosome segregation ATPase